MLKKKEEEFEKVVKEIKKYSKYTEDRIRTALYKLCDEAYIPYPLDDWKHDYLTFNSGRKIKEILNYLDTNRDIWIGISLKSLRLIEANELEKEIC